MNQSRKLPLRKISGIILLTILSLLMRADTACGAVADKNQPGAARPKDAYKLEQGPLGVKVISEIVLKDSTRAKDLPVRIYYPYAKGPFPVIIFSHGAGGSKEGYAYLGHHWASHGYVCIHPSHADSVAMNRKKGREYSLRDAVREALTDPKAWRNRPKDISFIIDSLGEFEKEAPQLKGKMDRARIGVGGHSFGAYTSQLIGGAKIAAEQAGKTKNFRDSRVSAVLLISAQGPGQMGLATGSWDSMSLPMMDMTGSEDKGALGQSPEWRMEAFRSSPAGDKYHVFVEGATHGSFTGLVLKGRNRLTDAISGTDPKILDYTKIATTSFWDAYLKGDRKAKKYLQGNALEDYSSGAVSIDRR